MPPVPFRSTAASPAVLALKSVGARLSRRPSIDAPTADRAIVSDIHVETTTWSEVATRAGEWSRLAASALEPNAFLEPSFAIPAAQHLDSLREARFLIVSTRAEPSRMIGLWPLAAPSLGGLARTWMHDYSACGAPLLDRERAADALDAILLGLAERAANIAGIAAPIVAADGPTAALFGASAERLGLSFRILDIRERPILSCAPNESALDAQTVRERKTARALRKLKSTGASCAHRVWRTPQEIKVAIELFLALEASGWKGRRGTALMQDPRAATFVRTMSRLMAKDEKIEIDALCADDRPIAMTISLRSQRRTFLWKTAYDETMAAFSPGAQLIPLISQRLIDDATIDSADSCASNDNPTIRRLWRESARIGDAYLSCAPDRSALFEAALAREEFRKAVSTGARAALKAARDQRR